MRDDQPEHLTIRPAAESLPQDVRGLATESAGFGIRNVSALVEQWADGTQRFDRPGEQLLVAWHGDSAVGVGGLTECPHVAGAFRVRRFYVAESTRRKGVARKLAEQLVESGLLHADTITCNARASDAAGPFWEAMGFHRVDIDGITHIRYRID